MMSSFANSFAALLSDSEGSDTESVTDTVSERSGSRPTSPALSQPEILAISYDPLLLDEETIPVAVAALKACVEAVEAGSSAQLDEAFMNFVQKLEGVRECQRSLVTLGVYGESATVRGEYYQGYNEFHPSLKALLGLSIQKNKPVATKALFQQVIANSDRDVASEYANALLPGDSVINSATSYLSGYITRDRSASISGLPVYGGPTAADMATFFAELDPVVESKPGDLSPR